MFSLLIPFVFKREEREEYVDWISRRLSSLSLFSSLIFYYHPRAYVSGTRDDRISFYSLDLLCKLINSSFSLSYFFPLSPPGSRNNRLQDTGTRLQDGSFFRYSLSRIYLISFHFSLFVSRDPKDNKKTNEK